uniref:Interferon regulatory factor 5-like n=1 Tax=Gouania willdenowi TaxID=441366 RepID=A0A8C5GDX2_GOUWI
MSGAQRRIRLKPWLLDQVNSGRFDGLYWLGPERRLFQIPWKHATRHTPASEEENTVFKAWAVETGKYQEGVDGPDPAKWKANLRCALNKSREFKLKFDGTKETPVQPYKIYEFHLLSLNSSSSLQMPNLMDLTINPQLSDSAPFGAFGHSQMIPAPLLPMTSDLQVEGGFAGLQDPNPLQNQIQNQVEPQNPQPCKYDLLNSVPLTDLDLKFQYRGRTVGSLTVSNPQGCRLYYGQLEPNAAQVELLGPVSLQQVLFPGTSQVQHHKQRFYTEALLEVMERGLILELWEQDIYAVRLCQCKVFWSGPGVTEPGPPNPLERERKVKVFSLNAFLQDLIRFQKGHAPNPPAFDIWFCFGEDWPDRKPKEKKLIMVQVVPVVARILTEMFSGELSWSTDSIRLQISNPDVKDQTVEQFKELQRLLQSQHIHGPWTSTGS